MKPFASALLGPCLLAAASLSFAAGAAPGGLGITPDGLARVDRSASGAHLLTNLTQDPISCLTRGTKGSGEGMAPTGEIQNALILQPRETATPYPGRELLRLSAQCNSAPSLRAPWLRP